MWPWPIADQAGTAAARRRAARHLHLRQPRERHLGRAIGRVRRSLLDLALPEGYAISFGSEFEEQQEAPRDFTVAIAMAMLLVYMLMAGQFERSSTA